MSERSGRVRYRMEYDKNFFPIYNCARAIVLLCLLHKSRLPLLRKASDLSTADWRYQTREKLSLYYTCAVTASLRAENPYKAPQFM